MGEQEILKITNVSKSFSGVKVLKNISLTLSVGEIHALVGENGAGKSTLNKLICGVYNYESGDIIFKGKPLPKGDTIKIKELGIYMIPQDLGLMKKLSVMHNILLGRESRKLGIINLKLSRNICKRILNDMDINLDLDKLVGELSIDQQQFVAIARALSANAELIIFDEPTSTLSESEVNNLFRIICNLKQQNITIIYVSHRLDEIFQIADNVTILKDGILVKTTAVRNITKNEVVNNMIGRTLSNQFPEKRKYPSEKCLMKLNNVTVKNKIYDINLDIMGGEILGIGGLVGMGQSALLNSIFGSLRIDSGYISLEGEKLTNINPTNSIRRGIYFISSDRRDEMLFMCRSVKENISFATLKDYQRLKVINQNLELKAVNEQIAKYNIVVSGVNQEVQYLSGGNQQKVILARWLFHKPKLLLLDEPTQGIDVGTKEDIYRNLRQLANEGITIVVVLSDMLELLGLCDRISIIYEGRLMKSFISKEATEEKIIAAASGHI